MNEISELFQNQDVRIQIREYVRINNIKYSIVARAMGIDPGHLKRVMDEERTISPKVLAALNKELNTQFKFPE